MPPRPPEPGDPDGTNAGPGRIGARPAAARHGTRRNGRRLWLAGGGVVVAAATAVTGILKLGFRSDDAPVHAFTTPARDLFARYAERMMTENELDAYIGGFHLDALTSGVPLNVDLDTTLTVVAGNLYRLLARKLDRYENATPDRIWRHFLDATGALHITGNTVTCALNLRSHHPVLTDAGFADLQVPIPWWHGRTLRFRFPPR